MGDLEKYYWILFGISIIISFYSFVFFTLTKNKIYLYYFFYILSVNYLHMASTGMGERNIWGSYTYFAHISHPLAYFLTTLNVCLFTKYFLNTKNFLKKIDLLLQIYVTLSLSFIALSFIDYSLAVQCIAGMTLTLPFLLLLSAILAMRQHISGAQYYMIARLGLCVGIIVYFLYRAAVLPSFSLFSYAIQIASIFEIILMSVALAKKALSIQTQAQNDDHITRNMKSISRITGAFAHEINNPLTMLQLGMDTLDYQFKDSKLSVSDYQKTIEKVRFNIIRIVDIINKFREIIVENDLNTPDQCDLREVLETSIQICQSKLEERKIEYSTKITGKSFTLHLIKEEVCLAIVNLIQNSIDALEKTKNPKIQFCITSNESIEFSITDNGSGILKEHRLSIFEPFFTTKEYHNLGLGLTQAFRLIEKNRGKLFLSKGFSKTKFIIKFTKIAETSL